METAGERPTGSRRGRVRPVEAGSIPGPPGTPIPGESHTAGRTSEIMIEGVPPSGSVLRALGPGRPPVEDVAMAGYVPDRTSVEGQEPSTDVVPGVEHQTQQPVDHQILTALDIDAESNPLIQEDISYVCPSGATEPIIGEGEPLLRSQTRRSTDLRERERRRRLDRADAEYNEVYDRPHSSREGREATLRFETQVALINAHYPTSDGGDDDWISGETSSRPEIPPPRYSRHDSQNDASRSRASHAPREHESNPTGYSQRNQ